MREIFPFFLRRTCAQREQVEIERAKEFVGFFREGKLVLSGAVVPSTSTVWLCIRLEDFSTEENSEKLNKISLSAVKSI